MVLAYLSGRTSIKCVVAGAAALALLRRRAGAAEGPRRRDRRQLSQRVLVFGAVFGIGVGWLEEEFDGLGIPFNDRAKRTRESVAALRSLWKADPEAFDGKFYNWGPMHSNPKPVQAHLPIVMGGHTDISAKRAARYCDGFFPAIADPEKIGHLIQVLNAECDKLGRDPSEIELSVGAGAIDIDGVKRLEDMGVDRIGVAPAGFDKATLEQGLSAFHDAVLSKI